jgi:hypothetical protein
MKRNLKRVRKGMFGDRECEIIKYRIKATKIDTRARKERSKETIEGNAINKARLLGKCVAFSPFFYQGNLFCGMKRC